MRPQMDLAPMSHHMLMQTNRKSAPEMVLKMSLNAFFLSVLKTLAGL
jgi:hypothetical protein